MCPVPRSSKRRMLSCTVEREQTYQLIGLLRRWAMPRTGQGADRFLKLRRLARVRSGAVSLRCRGAREEKWTDESSSQSCRYCSAFISRFPTNLVSLPVLTSANHQAVREIPLTGTPGATVVPNSAVKLRLQGEKRRKANKRHGFR